MVKRMETSACEDLKAFERRFTEVVSAYRPFTLRWRMTLLLLSISAAVSAWYWLKDPRTSILPLSESLLLHSTFTAIVLVLVSLFICGIHKWVIAPQIITARMRTVLSDFNMSCDDTGKLILKPRTNNN